MKAKPKTDRQKNRRQKNGSHVPVVDIPVRKPATKKARAALPASLADLHEDPENPRTIGEAASAALGTSLDEFGDISGIVFNVRPTKASPQGSLVCGHQRVDQLRAAHGELKLHLAPSLATGSARESAGEAYLETAQGDRFRVRLVDWPRKKHLAAMLAANSGQLAGEWTDGLGLLLETVQAESRELFDALLLDQLAAAGPAAESSDPEASVQVPEVFQLVIECKSEREQQRWFKKLEAEGLSVKVQTM